MNPNEIVRFKGDLRVEHFKSLQDRFSTGKAWKEWIENFERQLRFFNVKNVSDRKDALLIFGGNEITRLDKWLPDPRGKYDDFEKVKKKLTDYYVPQINKHYARYMFIKMRPKPRERIMTYYTRLREQADECDFNDSCEDRILEHLIQTVKNPQLIQKCLRKEWTLFQFLQEAQKAEEIREQMCCKGNWQKDVLKACGYCGLSGVHPKGWACPAFGKRCYRCHKIDHFAAVCRTKLERKYDIFSRYKDEHGNEHMGGKKQRTKRYRTDNLNNNIMPKTVGHLIVNHLQKSDTKKIEIMLREDTLKKHYQDKRVDTIEKLDNQLSKVEKMKPKRK